MRIKRIVLENIRSYEYQEVVFPTGSTLLSGNIGSGKTSVLLGIEFAFFGLQPGQKGTSLLRNGKNAAKVTMDFEVAGKEITIERVLKRSAKGINQDTCLVSVDGEKRELAVTEAKDLILKILNYPSELSKKQNLLYKFTVYTPQEEMKQIILEDSDTRLNTLRQVFGIDKYKQILENVGVVVTKLKEEKKIREGLTINIEQEKAALVVKEKELELKQKHSIIAKKDLFDKLILRKELEKELQEISKKREEKIKLTQEIDKTKLIINSKKQLIIENKKFEQQLFDQIKEISSLKFSEEKLKAIEVQIDTLKKQKEEVQNHNMDISTRMQALSIKNEENELVKKKLKLIEVCPTCLQDVSCVYKSNVISKLDSSSEKNILDIKKFNLEKQALVAEARKIEESITELNKQHQELKLIKIRLTDILSKEKKIQELIQANLSLDKDIALLNEHLTSLNSQIFDLGKFDIMHETKQQEVDNALRAERMSEILFAELNKEVEMFFRQIGEDKMRIDKIEQIKQELTRLSNLEEWLSKQFIPLITHIEKNVMAKLKKEFSLKFSEWFSMLVSENFSIRLSDDFSPIIEQQDYELDYAFLSGGERTAVALAYRLALNQVINSVLSKINTKDLVILDEPTDGFSEQQLDKMRDVLQELNVSQLIVVSHEQKIEGFVDNVIKLKKENGISGKL